MKRFLFKLFIFGVIILSILSVYNAAYNQLRSDDFYGDGKFVHVPMNITISNTGSSHGVYAFDYSELGQQETGFNFALISQSLTYDYRILREYRNHLADGGVLFIPVSYPSFSVDEEAGEDFESKNQRYYRFLSPANIKCFDINTYAGLHFFPALYESTADVMKIFIKGILNKRPIIEDTYDVDNTEFDYAADADKAFHRHYKVNEDGSISINHEEIKALYSIIDLCKDKGIRPVLISTPLRSEYADMYDQQFLDEFYSIINDVQKRTGCEYYDYSHDKRFEQSQPYMRNSDHLSAEGAKAFTKIIMDEIVNHSISEE